MYKVLIVDDELLIRQGMRNMIHWEELGMEIVRDVDSGEKAFAYLCEKSVDILITDIRMEGMDGLTLIQKAKEKIKKAKEELGWEATKGIEEMCKDSWNFIEKQKGNN